MWNPKLSNVRRWSLQSVLGANLQIRIKLVFFFVGCTSVTLAMQTLCRKSQHKSEIRFGMFVAKVSKQFLGAKNHVLSLIKTVNPVQAGIEIISCARWSCTGWPVQGHLAPDDPVQASLYRVILEPKCLRLITFDFCSKKQSIQKL